ncbi:MAG TPA: hypothetical protein VJ729_00970 [Nitrososphaeraceae archaeon]|jgi:hypothetical protein|nr:hypothetical protein [Nitrososphaeraceae archaeon]
MGKVAEKLKQKLTGAKNKVKGAADKTTSKAKQGVSSPDASTGKARTNQQSRRFEEGGPGTETGRKDDPLTEYREKEPMTPAKIKEHEPTAVKREMSERISEAGQTTQSSQDAAEKARRSGMTKGTAGAADTGSEYEQGAAGSNK